MSKIALEPSTAPQALPKRVAAVMVSLRPDGGAETLIRTLIDELDPEEYEVEVFTLREPRHRGSGTDAMGVPVHSFPGRRLVDPRRFARFVRAVRAGDFDVIHTNLPAANILGLLCGRLLGIPVVVVLHNSETGADDHWYHGRLERLLIGRYASQVIAVGERTANARRDMLPNATVDVLPNAVPPSTPLTAEERRALRATLMTDPDRSLLLAVGRLTEQKAHDDLVAAFAVVAERRSDVELAIAGRGRKEAELRAMIDELGLADRIHLLGVRDDVRDVMWASDVFVMSSRWEGLPVALLEAMEAGLPVVSTAVGDVPEVVRDAAATLVPVGDRDSLADAIGSMLETDRCELGAINRRVIADRYSSHSWALAVSAHYEDAIGRSAIGGSAN